MFKLLFIGNFMSHTWGSRAVLDELKYRLEKQGHEIVTTSSIRNGYMRLLDMLAVTLTQYRSTKLAVIDVYSGRAFLWAEIVSRLLRLTATPYILVLQGGNLPKFNQRWPLRVKRLLNSASYVVTPSRYLLGNLSAVRKDIQYLPNAIEIADYPFRLRGGASPDIVWLRAFHAIYDPCLAVRALAIIRSEFPSAKLTMAGPDKGDGSLEEVEHTATELGVADRLTIYGAVPKQEVPGWLERGEIFLNTTTAESFGVAMMEAAAVGLPIISTSAGEIPYLWKDQEEALLVPCGDEGGMARSVMRILADRALAEHLSTRARTKAEGYDWANILPKWDTLIQNAIEAQG